MNSELGFIYFLVLSLCFFTSCDKYKAKQMAGEYACKIHENSFNLSTGYFDTVKQESIQVGRSGKNVIVLGHEIQVDLLRKSAIYRTGSAANGYTFWVYFTKDSVYAERWGGGLGGNGTSTYKCRKL